MDCTQRREVERESMRDRLRHEASTLEELIRSRRNALLGRPRRHIG